jgi:P27 family predicted phage terminase small subunit
MPAGLSDLEREYWHSIVPTLLAMDVLTTIDGSALAGCCMAYADMVGAREDIEKHGRLIEQEHCDSKGGYLGTSIKANPAVAQADRAAKRWKSFLIEFGMTPASRSRLSTSPDAEKPKDPADKYFGAAEQGSGNTLQ